MIQENQMDEVLEKRVKLLRILGRLNYFRRFNVHIAELLEITNSELTKITNSETLKKK